MTNEQLLGEIEDLIRNIPDPSAAADSDLMWVGRVKAAFNIWDPIRSPLFGIYVDHVIAPDQMVRKRGLSKTAIALHEISSDLRVSG